MIAEASPGRCSYCLGEKSVKIVNRDLYKFFCVVRKVKLTQVKLCAVCYKKVNSSYLRSVAKLDAKQSGPSDTTANTITSNNNSANVQDLNRNSTSQSTESKTTPSIETIVLSNQSIENIVISSGSDRNISTRSKKNESVSAVPIFPVRTINESSDSDDTFDPQVRMPHVQPLIKKRKFTDEDAPIFRTDNIFGG